MAKIDRDTLPAPAQDDERESSFVVPRDNIENHLVRIWQKLLHLRKVGVGDNFFDLGGHSLLAVQLMKRIDVSFNRKLPVDILWVGDGPIERFIAEMSVGQSAADNLGWSHWSRGAIRLHRLPGRHTDLVKPPIVDDLAARLQACIDVAAPG